jgi:hypothetical protein
MARVHQSALLGVLARVFIHGHNKSKATAGSSASQTCFHRDDLRGPVLTFLTNTFA